MTKPGHMAILPTTYPGQPAVDELAWEASAGVRPRVAYVELARRLKGHVVDARYMETLANPLAKVIARRLGLPAGQICEAFLRRRRYSEIFAWADRLGLPLAMLNKLTRSQQQVVLYSVWLSRGKKAVFLRHLKVHSHLAAVLNYGSVQMQFAADELRVPREKLHVVLQPVDDRFWTPQGVPPEDLICAVGWEARDYRTFLAAMRGMSSQVHIALGIAGLMSTAGVAEAKPRRKERSAGTSRFDVLRGTYSYGLHQDWIRSLRNAPQPNVEVSEQLGPLDLRNLYDRARFVVVPLHDVDADCGVTTITEAMAMSKAVIVSRTRGQIDLIDDGEQGIYVPPADPTALRSAVQYLLENPNEAERMGTAGRALAEERHSMDDHVDRLAMLFADAVGLGERDVYGEPR